MSRGVGNTLAGLGFLAIIAGLVLMFIITPMLKVFPDDTDATRTYNLDFLTLLDGETLEFYQAAPGENPNLRIERRVQVAAVEGEHMLLREEQRLLDGNTLLAENLYHYPLHRRTMQTLDVGDFPAEWEDYEGYWQREGLVVGWGIGVEAENYQGWNEDTRQTVTLEYVGEAEHGGIDTYHYVSSRPPEPIAAAQVAALGLPASISRADMTRLAAGIQAEGIELELLARLRLLDLITAGAETMGYSEEIPLAYFFSYEGDYWVEPTTGVLIDTHKHEKRSASFPDEILQYVNEALATQSQVEGDRDYLPPDIMARLFPVTVNEFSYTASEQSLDDARADADAARSRLQLVGESLPLGMMALGGLLLLAGLLGPRLWQQEPA